MTEKEMKKLSRAELLELLLTQTRESERLRRRLEKAEQDLEDRKVQVEKAGDLAQAVLQINGVMDAAQAAARQYLENIARMERETKLRCEKLLAQARAEAEQIRAGAQSPEGAEQKLLREIYDLLDNENGAPKQ